jgi:hypothetical protein
MGQGPTANGLGATLLGVCTPAEKRNNDDDGQSKYGCAAVGSNCRDCVRLQGVTPYIKVAAESLMSR